MPLHHYECEHCDCKMWRSFPLNEDATILCDNCNEAAYDRQQERLMSDGGGPSLIEQQQAAYKVKHGLR